MSMKLELTISTSAGPETVALALEKAARKVSDGTDQAALYDSNGTRIGSFITVNWEDADSVFRYAGHHGLYVRKRSIVDTPEEGLTLDGVPVEQWFADILGN